MTYLKLKMSSPPDLNRKTTPRYDTLLFSFTDRRNCSVPRSDHRRQNKNCRSSSGPTSAVRPPTTWQFHVTAIFWSLRPSLSDSLTTWYLMTCTILAGHAENVCFKYTSHPQRPSVPTADCSLTVIRAAALAKTNQNELESIQKWTQKWQPSL